MIWDYGTGEQKNWMIATDSFNRPELTKYEAVSYTHLTLPTIA